MIRGSCLCALPKNVYATELTPVNTCLASFNPNTTSVPPPWLLALFIAAMTDCGLSFNEIIVLAVSPNITTPIFVGGN